MLSKYGNDNATQAEFLEWLHRLRDEGYPTDCYVFDYGWRGDVADNGNPPVSYTHLDVYKRQPICPSKI